MVAKSSDKYICSSALAIFGVRDFPFHFFPLYTPVNISFFAAVTAPLHEPYSVSILAAHPAPHPETPGMLSPESPAKPLRAGISSGGTPHFASTSLITLLISQAIIAVITFVINSN